MKRDGDFSTRRVVLNLLKTNGAMSVRALAHELEITEMAVRRHIHTLERDGWIESDMVRQPMGRPSRLYSLTADAEELFPKNYHTLALDLLGELETGEGEAQVGELFERRRRKLFGKYAERMKDKTLPERIAELADIQNTGGYMVQWKASGRDFVFEEYNCPIAQVANRYNAACTCELALFEKLLDARVERTECLAKNGRKCTYFIQAAE